MMISRGACASVTCALLFSFACLAAAGCSGGARDLDLDKETARSALTRFLDAWSKGETMDALKSGEQPIVGRDPDWAAKKKLVSYKLGEETDDGTNAHITTQLVVVEDGREETKEITYIVGTDPAVTVFRKDE